MDMSLKNNGGGSHAGVETGSASSVPVARNVSSAFSGIPTAQVSTQGAAIGTVHDWKSREAQVPVFEGFQ